MEKRETTVNDGAKREQTGYFLKQQPILDGDIVVQHCEMVDDHSGKVSTQPNRLLVCWNGSSWDVKCLDAMVGYKDQYWGYIPSFHEVVGNAVDNPEMIPSEVEWTRKDSKPVRDGLPTAHNVLSDAYQRHGWLFQPDVLPSGACPHERIAMEAMQSYSDQQNAELREKLSRLGAMHEDIVVENAKIREGFRQKDERIAVMEERVKELEGAIDTAIGILKITSSPYAQDEEAIATSADILFESKNALKK